MCYKNLFIQSIGFAIVNFWIENATQMQLQLLIRFFRMTKRNLGELGRRQVSWRAHGLETQKPFLSGPSLIYIDI